MPANKRTMKLSDLLTEDLVVPDLAAASKRDVLECLVALLARRGFLTDPQRVVAELMDREEQLSTGVGEGVAIPHVYSDAVKEHRVVFAHVPGGVPYDSADDKPVKYIFLVIAPPFSPETHINIVSATARLIRQTDFLQRVNNRTTCAELLDAVREAEQSL